MPNLPKARAAIVAEIIRPEGDGKISILGFFGISPQVKIGLTSIPGALQNLAILVACEDVTDPGRPNVEIQITAPDGSQLYERASIGEFPELVRGTAGAIVVNLAQMPLTMRGKYRVDFYDAERLHSSAEFDVMLTDELRAIREMGSQFIGKPWANM